MHFIDVKECLAADLASVWSKQDVLASLLLHLVCQGNGLLKLEVLEQRLRELSEAVRVGVLLAHDHWQGNSFERVCLQQGELDPAVTGLRPGLVVGASEQESSDHVSHQVLRAQLNHVEVGVTEVGSVGQQRGEHSIGVRGREREDKRPVE